MEGRFGIGHDGVGDKLCGVVAESDAEMGLYKHDVDVDNSGLGMHHRANAEI